MDFPQQLEACVKQANQALSRFIAPLPFQNTPVVETMQYGALLGGKTYRTVAVIDGTEWHFHWQHFICH